MGSQNTVQLRIRRVLTALIPLLAALGVAAPAHAGAGVTLVVDRADDDAASTACTDAPNDCSLRGALSVTNANGNAEEDTIVLAVAGPILLANGQLEVHGPVAIAPAEPDAVVVVDANGPRRIFIVAPSAELHLTRLVLRGADHGGAGGAVGVLGGRLTITDSVVEDNRAVNGGAISSFNGASVVIVDSEVRGNTAAFYGGLELNESTTTITGSTIAGNHATGGGGGGIDAFRGSLQLTNSTVHGNSSVGGEGGIGASWGETSVVLDVMNSTITGNDSGSAGAAENLGGAQLTIGLFNSVIGDPPSGPNCDLASSSVTDWGGNAFDDDSCLGAGSGAVFEDLLLGPLQDNGGPTRTRALDPGSPAVDRGLDQGVQQEQPPKLRGVVLLAPTCPAVDQRGEPRPADPMATGTPRCDAGSYELQPAQPPPPPPPPPAPPPSPPPPPPAEPDLVLDKDGPLEAPIDMAFAFTLSVTNEGAGMADGVTLGDEIPDGLEVVDAPEACTVDQEAGTVACALGTLAPGGVVDVSLSVRAAAAGTYTNTAVVATTSAESDTTDNTDDHTVEVSEVPRVGDAERIRTAIRGSRLVFPDGEAAAVVLTRADLFPDAQAGTPLAVAVGAPILLSAPAALSPDSEEEILRVLPEGGTVHLLGGVEALSTAVEDRVRELGYEAVRYGGANRFGTAVLIAAQGLGDPDSVILADGGDFADAVVAGAAAVVAGGADDFAQQRPDVAAVLLTSDADVPPETAAYLEGRDVTRYAVGGDAAAAFPSAEALVGDDRFDTSVVVADRFFREPTTAGVATGLDFADALTGGAVLGLIDGGPGPMLLTEREALPAVVSGWITDHAEDLLTVYVFGGEAAVSAGVEAEIEEALAG